MHYADPGNRKGRIKTSAKNKARLIPSERPSNPPPSGTGNARPSPAERRRRSAGFSVGARGRAGEGGFWGGGLVGREIVDVMVANHPRSVGLHNPISWSGGAETERAVTGRRVL
ncbi:hypothetical protein P171DRAFT_445651 [Karstenula rhodostoma CBS 690.94]|uniref:Uncharacterized protein n=1 Tax=Karstenula rhodostoma CBS 690.94 TaxID=1392251 RepID=A0A9P4PDQ7_9PLEO|nr:hypothetical protein P171DRAFT_445651 [Karstenula rhodostoma CBS 690.94]